MEKNIKKRVCRLALVVIAVLVVLFGYWFFLNPHGSVSYTHLTLPTNSRV